MLAKRTIHGSCNSVIKFHNYTTTCLDKRDNFFIFLAGPLRSEGTEGGRYASEVDSRCSKSMWRSNRSFDYRYIDAFEILWSRFLTYTASSTLQFVMFSDDNVVFLCSIELIKKLLQSDKLSLNLKINSTYSSKGKMAYVDDYPISININDQSNK